MIALFMTHFTKRGPFPHNSDGELDLSAESVKSVQYVRAHEKCVMLVHRVLKLWSL